MTTADGERLDQFLAAYVAFLEGEAARPSPAHLDVTERAEAEDLVQLLEATRGVGGPSCPALADDPVAIRLGYAKPQERSVGRSRRCRRRFALGRGGDRSAIRRLSDAVAAGPALATRQTGAVAVLTVISLVAAFFVILAMPGSGIKPAFAMVPLRGTCPAALSGETRQIEVAGVWAGEEQNRFSEVLERFMDREGIGVTFANGSLDPDEANRNFAATLQGRIDQGCPPDVALLPQPGLLRSLASSGDLRPVEGRNRELVEQNYSPAWRELATVDGKLYGVWFKAAHKSTIWYDDGAFTRAQVQGEPTTWAELMDAAAQLANDDSGISPFSMAGADGWALTDWFENILLATAGPEVYRQLANHEIPWTDARVKESLDRMAHIFRQEDWIIGGNTTTYEESVDNVFSIGRPKGAMVLAADYAATQIEFSNAAKEGDVPVFEFPEMTYEVDDAVPSPQGRPIVLGGDVAVQLSDDPAAAALLAFLAEPESVEPWVSAGGFISPNKKVDLMSYPEAIRPLAQVVASADTVNFDLSDLQPPGFGATPGQGMWAIFQQFMTDPNVDSMARRLEDGALMAKAQAGG